MCMHVYYARQGVFEEDKADDRTPPPTHQDIKFKIYFLCRNFN